MKLIWKLILFWQNKHEDIVPDVKFDVIVGAIFLIGIIFASIAVYEIRLASSIHTTNVPTPPRSTNTNSPSMKVASFIVNPLIDIEENLPLGDRDKSSNIEQKITKSVQSESCLTVNDPTEPNSKVNFHLISFLTLSFTLSLSLPRRKILLFWRLWNTQNFISKKILFHFFIFPSLSLIR